MRLMLNFIGRGGGHIHCMAEDGRTRITPWLQFQRTETMLRLISLCNPLPPERMHNGEMDKTWQEAFEWWGQGSVWCEPDERAIGLLHVYPWAIQ